MLAPDCGPVGSAGHNWSVFLSRLQPCAARSAAREGGSRGRKPVPDSILGLSPWLAPSRQRPPQAGAQGVSFAASALSL
jgi:hypothetical protein